MRPQLVFERWPEDARLDARGTRGLVDLQHAVQVREVDGDHGPPIVRRFNAAHDRGPASVRDRHAVGIGRPLERSHHFALVARERDHVRRIGEVAVDSAQRVEVALAIGVERPLVLVRRAELLKRGWNGDARLAQLDRREVGQWRRCDLDPEPPREALSRGLAFRHRRLVALHSPRPEAASHHACLPARGRGRAQSTPCTARSPSQRPSAARRADLLDMTEIRPQCLPPLR